MACDFCEYENVDGDTKPCRDCTFNGGSHHRFKERKYPTLIIFKAKRESFRYDGPDLHFSIRPVNDENIKQVIDMLEVLRICLRSIRRGKQW